MSQGDQNKGTAKHPTTHTRVVLTHLSLPVIALVNVAKGFEVRTSELRNTKLTHAFDAVTRHSGPQRPNLLGVNQLLHLYMRGPLKPNSPPHILERVEMA